MAPKGVSLFLLMSCAALSIKAARWFGDEKQGKMESGKLMEDCKRKGVPQPSQTLINTVFGNSSRSSKDKDTGPSRGIPAFFLSSMHRLFPDKTGQILTNTAPNMDLDCSVLLEVIKQKKSSTDPSICYMNAFTSPLSFSAVDQKCVNEGADDYGTFLLDARDLVTGSSSSSVTLPATKVPYFEKWMEMLDSKFNEMSEYKKKAVVKWVKEQNDLNCTKEAPPDSKTKSCELSGKMMGIMKSFFVKIKPEDLNSSTELCNYFRSSISKHVLKRINSPTVTNMLWRKYSECFKGQEVEKNLEKLGEMACVYKPPVSLTPEIAKRLLPQMSRCDEEKYPFIKMQMKKLSIFLEKTTPDPKTEELNINYLSSKSLSNYSCDDIKRGLKKLERNVRLKRYLQRTVVKKCLGVKMCKEMSLKEMKDFEHIIQHLPKCVLQQFKAKDVLSDADGLKKISENMRRRQKNALVHEMMKNGDPVKIIQELPPNLFPYVPVKYLKKVIKNLDQMKNYNLGKIQALKIMKYMFREKVPDFRKLRSLVQGVTCKAIEEVQDGDVKSMIKGLAENSRWMSKVQARCAARKYFQTLEKKRNNFFKTITEDEMEQIPPVFLLYLSPPKIKDLPDSVCSELTEKMQEVNLNLSPRLSRSCSALTDRILLCISNGEHLSALTTEQVLQLGPLLCELPPSKLQLMDRSVLKSIIEEMASCTHIPLRHRGDLIQLVIKNFGNISRMSEETLETLGPLLLCDDNATAALPCEVDVLNYLNARMAHKCPGLMKRIFECNTKSTPDKGHNKKEADAPSEEQIVILGAGVVFFPPAELKKIPTDTFTDTVEIFSDVPNFNSEQLAVLLKKAVEAFGPVSQMTDDDLLELGCLSRGFSDRELEMLPFSMELMEDIDHCDWTDSQIEAVLRAVFRQDSLEVQRMEVPELSYLGRFICGLNFSNIMQINLEEFKDALDSINDVQCSHNAFKKFKRLAVLVFGDPANWTEAEISELCNFAAGIDGDELASLNEGVISALCPDFISITPPANFRMLTVSQLSALAPDSAAQVTEEQRAVLSERQLSALESAETGAVTLRETSPPDPEPDPSGAPSLTIEGILSFMRPLLFLLMGFILL